MELSLPEEKFYRARDLLAWVKGKKYISKHQLESLAGTLSHCSTVVRGGRTFCRRVYNLCKIVLKNKWKCARLNTVVMGDIDWWYNCIVIINVTSQCAGHLYKNVEK